MMDRTTQNRVDRLIDLYKTYKIIETSGDHALLSSIGDSIRFETPLIWLVYKFLAYQGTAQEIKTIADLRAHCSHPGDLCMKRYEFVKHILNSISEQNSISFLWENTDITSMLCSKKFVDAWRRYEFYEIDGVICKWQNNHDTLEIV